MKDAPLKICYFGIYEPVAPRDKVYLQGLQKRGTEVVTCVDNSRGLLKFFRLAKKLQTLHGTYDILWVGYLSTMVVPLARLFSDKKIVFNALDSWYDRTVRDRAMYSPFSPKALLIWLFDFLAFHLAHTVLVESEAQKQFIAGQFWMRKAKLHVIFTGVDEEIFHPDPAVPKAADFTVVLRGMFLPATGVEVVLEAAKLLKHEQVKFIIIGWGEPIQAKIKKMIADEDLTNVTLITWFLPPEELRRTMLSAHVMLGQFADHPRLDRTIQNKNFEALALGMPYITRDSISNRELFTSDVNCLFVHAADAWDLGEKIRMLSINPERRVRIGATAQETFIKKCNSKILGESLAHLLYTKSHENC